MHKGTHSVCNDEEEVEEEEEKKKEKMNLFMRAHIVQNR